MQKKDKVFLESIMYKEWKCKAIINGPLELILLPQVGGRIIGMKWKGHDLFFTEPEREGFIEKGLTKGEKILKRKGENGFPLWGGDKTWLSPQDRWTDGVPFIDLDRGSYSFLVKSSGPETVKVVMESPICRETGIQLTRTIETKSGFQEWVVTHQIENCSNSEVRWGIWDGTMVLRPGKAYLPRWKKSPYPLGIKTFDDEGDSISVRNKVVNVMGRLGVIDCGESHPFKYGVDAQEGWLLGIMEVKGGGLVGYRKQFQVFEELPYGHGCVSEVYNSDRYPYFQLEIHGPQVSLAPGERFALKERQALFDVLQWPRKEIEVREMVARSFSGKVGRK